MAVTPEDVKEASLTCEFKEDPPYSDVAIQLRIDRAELFVNADLWGDLADPGVTNLAAHFLVMDSLGGVSSGGAIASEKAGDVAVGYTNPTPSRDDQSFTTTSYGRTFLTLRQMVPAIGTTSYPTTGRSLN
ncbi:MAG: DUF4054 domain-containing protein [bacterium]|nr:DUF4054 domain-containing protein [bacterium]